MAELTISTSVEISYGGDFQATLEADNGCDPYDYEYESASATDSHNGAVDVCERVWYSVDGSEELCCTPDSRSGMIDGCAAFGYGDQEPVLCDASYEATCSGIDTTIVSTWQIEYTAMDYSENTADPVEVTVVLEDTIPPIIPAPEDCGDGDYVYEVEKCTYYEQPDLPAFDCVDLFVDSPSSVSFFELGSESVVFGTDYGTRSIATGVYCNGGVEVAEVDVDTPGVYCIEYTSEDTSFNVAISETLVVYVEDTTPPNVHIENPEIELECYSGDRFAEIDGGATADNLPCLDTPAAPISYQFTDHPVLCENNDGECEDVTEIWSHVDSKIMYDSEGNVVDSDWPTRVSVIPYVAFDGYNYGTGYSTVTTVDTTPPDITCPNDIFEHVTGDECGSHFGYSWTFEGVSDLPSAYDQCSPNVNQLTVDCEGGDLVDEGEVGVYTVTWCAKDGVALKSCCEQTITVVDETAPVCDFCDPCGDSDAYDVCHGSEYQELEACQEEAYLGDVTCVDDHDGDISHLVTSTWVGAEYDASVEGTYYIVYSVSDSNGNAADSITRTIVNVDTTAPVVTTNGDLVYAEASVLDVATSSSATDECCDYLSGSFSAEALDFSHCASFDFGITSEYWFNVYGDSATEFIYYCGESIDEADAAAAAATSSQNDDELAAACAAYTVTWAWTDCANSPNTGYATQTVWTIDTVQPSIGYTAYFATLPSASASGAFALVAGVALFAGLVVGRKTAQRTQYNTLV